MRRTGRLSPLLLPLGGLALALAAPAGAPAQSLTRLTGVHPAIAVQSSRAVNWVDLDGDGDLDLYVTNGGVINERNELYLNQGGTFARDTTSAAVRDSLRDDGSTWGDYDNDGDADLLLASWYGEVNALLRNLGGGAFERVTGIPLVTTGTYSEGAAWGDYDNDGDLDLYIANSGAGPFRDNLLYRNDGGGFVQVTSGPLVDDNTRSRGPCWADYDDDGDLDLFVATETGFPNKLYRNLLADSGMAAFEEAAAGDLTADAGNSWSGSWGDLDNDGDLDMVVANAGGENDFLYRNQLAESGIATFTRITGQDPALDAAWSASTAWADWDNDADLDLLVTCGWGPAPGTKQANRYYRNDGGTLVRSFESAAAADSGWSYGAAWGDADGDGDLDLCVANWQGVAQANYYYRNEAQANGNHWLQLDCRGTVSNRSGIGARITVKATVAGSPVSQVRRIAGADGYCGQTLRAHFGLASATVADTVIVRWPSGIVQHLVGVAADQTITVTESATSGLPGVSGPAAPASRPPVLAAGPCPFHEGVTLSWRLDAPAEVRLVVVDARGRLVREIAHARFAAGEHEMRWDGRAEDGRPAPSGIYHARLLAGGRAVGGCKLVISR